MNDLCSRLRNARRRAGLSQSALAKQLDINRSSVAQWEQPRGSTPTSTHLSKVAVLTKVNFEWLATGRGRIQEQSDDVESTANGALLLQYYAHDEVEERVLIAMRRLDYWQTLVVAQLAESLAAGKLAL